MAKTMLSNLRVRVFSGIESESCLEMVADTPALHCMAGAEREFTDYCDMIRRQVDSGDPRGLPEFLQLVQDLRSHGQQEPIKVRTRDGFLEVVDGGRRAAILWHQNGGDALVEIRVER